MPKNPFHVLAQRDPERAVLLAQAFAIMHHDIEEVYAAIRFASKVFQRDITGMIHGFGVFEGIIEDKEGNEVTKAEAEYIRDFAQEFLNR